MKLFACPHCARTCDCPMHQGPPPESVDTKLSAFCFDCQHLFIIENQEARHATQEETLVSVQGFQRMGMYTALGKCGHVLVSTEQIPAASAWGCAQPGSNVN